MPSWVPSSFIYCGDNSTKIRIFYTLTAWIEDNSITNTQVAPLPMISGKRRILISQMASEHITNVNIHAGEDIKSMGLID